MLLGCFVMSLHGGVVLWFELVARVLENLLLGCFVMSIHGGVFLLVQSGCWGVVGCR